MIAKQKSESPEFWVGDAQAALAKSPCFHGRNLSVDAESDALVLRGVVKSRNQKELAERTVRSVVTWLPLVNEIEIAVE